MNGSGWDLDVMLPLTMLFSFTCEDPFRIRIYQDALAMGAGPPDLIFLISQYFTK